MKNQLLLCTNLNIASGNMFGAMICLGFSTVFWIPENMKESKKFIIPLLLLSSNIHYISQSMPARLVSVFSWASLIAFVVDDVVGIVKSYFKIKDACKDIEPKMLGRSVELMFLGKNTKSILRIVDIILFQIVVNLTMLDKEELCGTIFAQPIPLFLTAVPVAIYLAYVIHLEITLLSKSLQFSLANQTTLSKEMIKLIPLVSVVTKGGKAFPYISSPEMYNMLLLQAHSAEIENLSAIFIGGVTTICSYALLCALDHKMSYTVLTDLGKVLCASAIGLSVGLITLPLVQRLVAYCISLVGPENNLE